MGLEANSVLLDRGLNEDSFPIITFEQRNGFFVSVGLSVKCRRLFFFFAFLPFLFVPS